MEKSIIYKPIGIIYSPFDSSQGVPIQPRAAKGVKGKVVIDKDYEEGLKDLEGFSHIILLYHFHLVKGFSLLVKPFMDKERRGIFATRAPRRPNPLGLSVVKLLKVEDNVLYIENVDIVNGTPLLDIKPFVPEFDIPKVEKIGWLKERVSKLAETRDDGRFVKDEG